MEDRWEIMQHAGMEFPFREEIQREVHIRTVEIVIGGDMTALLGYKDFGYCLHGDNVSSLSWAVHGGGLSPRAKAASMALALISIRIQSNLFAITYISGKLNIITDGESVARATTTRSDKKF
jgi:hypothetical protein